MPPDANPLHADHHYAGAASRLGWLALIPLSVFALALGQLGREADALAFAAAWIPSLGIDLAFRLDGLSLLFVLLISGIGTMVLVYAGGYMAGMAQRERLFVLLLLFMVAMLGCTTSDNLLLLFGFWELTSLTSFLLVGFKHEYESARKSAQQALMVTAGGGLVLLAGFILLGQAAGTYTISELLANADAWRDGPLVKPALVCIFIGAFTKSAQLPFHFWLPNAMAAPTPVSAYLHSATMVKLGVYLLARLDPAFDGVAMWHDVLVTIGAVTAAWSMLLTLRERDLKRILAWSTVSALGTLVMLIGLPGGDAAAAVTAFLLTHALYKAPLFFVAGNIDHCTGTRNIDHLAGLARAMPWTAAAAALAAVSMAGMPFSLGFVAKELIKISKSEADVFAWVSYSGVFVNAIAVAVASVAAIRVFWHRGGAPVPAEIREAGWAMRLPPVLIAALALVFGLWTGLLDQPLGAAAQAIHPALTAMPESLGREDTEALQAIAIALLLGVAVFVLWDRIHHGIERIMRPADPLGALAWYDRLLKAIPVLAGMLTRPLQSGRLSRYTLLCLGFVIALVAVALARPGAVALPAMQAPGLALAGACALLVSAAIAACLVRDAFVMLLVSGFVGLGSALAFLFLQAPDLAFTQFAVEVAFVVVIASILLRLRHLGLSARDDSPALPRVVVAFATAGVLTTLLLAATAGPLDSTVPDTLAALSVPEAHGRNVVNVILVDFRAVDTLGEIAVVALAFAGTLPLFALLRRRKEKSA